MAMLAIMMNGVFGQENHEHPHAGIWAQLAGDYLDSFSAVSEYLGALPLRSCPKYCNRPDSTNDSEL
jgi:hypothetical protein